jgi:predicted DNA-binding transcriptional regulator YafY
MSEVQTKAKRQIEILGHAFNNHTGLKDTDFAVMFDRDIPTIKRDMQELRSLGIDVHSEPSRGIRLTGRTFSGGSGAIRSWDPMRLLPT